MQMQHVQNCGEQTFIISRKGGTLLAINDFIYRSNLKRFGINSDKVYWECIHNRSKKCRSRLKTIGDDLYVTNGRWCDLIFYLFLIYTLFYLTDIHNHAGDRCRIELAKKSGILIRKKFSAIGLPASYNKPIFQ